MQKKTVKSSGRVYTPTYIVKNILDLSGYYGTTILKKHVIDNSCGDGAFLSEIVKRYCECAVNEYFPTSMIATDLETYIHGIEVDNVEQERCIERLNKTVNHYGIQNVRWDIICSDTLKVKRYDGKMDFVLGNPPYVRVHNLSGSIDDIKEFSFSKKGMTDLYIVFFEIGLTMLNSTGVLGYITPSSYFNSVAGSYMRKKFIELNLLDKLVDLRHYQAFSATTYTAITILKKQRIQTSLDYYRFDEKNLIPYYVDNLSPTEYWINTNFYFGTKSDLSFLKKVLCNFGASDIAVKNGYATLCDPIFIADFPFTSKYIIPVIKASSGNIRKIFYPYDKSAQLISEDELKKESLLYAYLLKHRFLLDKRSSEHTDDAHWYAFGRSQAIHDTYKNKLAVNTLLRTIDDWKFVDAPPGTGVYSGLYIISNTIPMINIKKALRSPDFISYISLLGKYKSGGYYTFSSKDVKTYLDYKFSYNGELLYDDQ